MDSAKEAALLAEWSSKTRVWIPDTEQGFVRGWIVSEQDDIATVAFDSGDQLRQIPTVDLARVNPPAFDGADDIAELTYLNEASVVHNLKTRYKDGAIYTYSGLFLVAINPYRSLPLYSPNVIAQYKRARREVNAPHVFAVAEEAWQKMTAHGESQSILVTGESGAGKTETTKKIIHYLATVAAEPLPASSSFDRLVRAQAEKPAASTLAGLGQLERKIIDANPILEAFGNAQTMRNDNSSRFGKFVRIFFNAAGAIVGANIDWYLLEKSRVTSRSVGERNYHVFYQLLRGADAATRRKLLLDGDSTAYEYLKHSASKVNGVDDRAEWQQLCTALNTLGFTEQEQLELLKVIAAILHLGNVQVAGSEQAHLVNPAQLEKIAFLLGLDESNLANALVRPKVKAGREWVTQARSPKQVTNELAALSKTLYEKLFGSIVDTVNAALGRPTTKTFIGVLDIAGFEIFETNGFEQLLINLTNEKLQQFFNHQAFVLEQEEYAREEIAWEFVNFGLELQPTIDLIESTNPMGILSCLDDETFMPKGSDKQFTEKLDTLYKTQPVLPSFAKYTPTRIEQGFTVSHYAGKVEYRTDGWLTKNRDPLNDNLASVMANSTESFISKLFSEFAETEALDVVAPRSKGRRGAFRTVGQRHKEDLAALMTQLNATQPHFIRCIVPNTKKQPSKIDVPLVLTQLRCNGVLEGIRIARIGFPNRLPFAEFRRRFGILAPPSLSLSRTTFVEGKEACSAILRSLDLDNQSFRLGLTKVFFKAGILAELESRRDDRLADIVTRLQATCRRQIVRRQANRVLNRAAAVETIQRNARVYLALRQWPWWKLYQQVRPLLAAARSDEEMRRKEQELAAAKEQATREAAQRVKLEEAAAALERQRVSMEKELAGERALLSDKDAALGRGIQRESQLKERLATMEEEAVAIEKQLRETNAVKAQLEERIINLDTTHDNQRKLLETLQAEQLAWKAKEAELASQTSVKTEEWNRVLSERDSNVTAASDLKRQLSEERQDRRREESRLTAAAHELETKLGMLSKESLDVRQQTVSLEKERQRLNEELVALRRAKESAEGQVVARSSELEQLKSDVAMISRQQQEATTRAAATDARARKLKQDLADHKSQLNTARSSHDKAVAEATTLKRLLEEKTSDHQRIAELNRLREAEVKDLQAQLDKANADGRTLRMTLSDTSNRLTGEVETARREAKDFHSKHVESEKRAVASNARVKALESQVEELERAQNAHDLRVELVRNEMSEKMLKEREMLEEQMATTRAQFSVLEDAAVEARRDRDAAKRETDAVRLQLAAERDNHSKTEEARKRLEVQIDQQYAVLNDLDKINGDLRSELASTKARLVVAEEKAGRTVVEHVRVLEEALRLQNSEMDRIRGDRDKREARITTLERAKDQLTRTLEDLQHERDADRRQAWATRSPVKEAPSRAGDELKEERKIRELAELNVERLRSDVAHMQKQFDAAMSEIKELKRSNAQMERDLSHVASSDQNESIVEGKGLHRNSLRDSRVMNALPSFSSQPNRMSLPSKPSMSSFSPSSPRRRNYE
ncbi:class II myosin [Microbotryomycetes sp. JL221]|nr:class II myosin [Microbotryomycetes sp. JL221]